VVKELLEEVVNSELNKEKVPGAAPILRREEIDKDIDKGLIMYRLKYVEQYMVTLVGALADCGVVGKSAAVDAVVWKALECYERAAAALDMRKGQNDCLVKARKTEYTSEMVDTNPNPNPNPNLNPDHDSDPDPDLSAEQDQKGPGASRPGADSRPCQRMETLDSRYMANMFNKTVAQAIEIVLLERGISKDGLEKEGITAADMFYAKLGGIEDLLHGLGTFYDQNFLNKNDEHMFRVLEIINGVCISALKAVKEARLAHKELYALPMSRRVFVWTGSQSLIQTLFHKNIAYSRKAILEFHCKNQETLQVQVLMLAELILDEMHLQIAAQGMERYDEYCIAAKELKSQLLDATTAINASETLDLAIRYRAYEKAVELCEMLHKYKKLDKLIEAWRGDDFLEIAFSWYIKAYASSQFLRENPKPEVIIPNNNNR
jgi:hypothetical protein